MELYSRIKTTNKGIVMPVKIGSFEPLSEEEFTALRQQKARKTDPAMVALLAEVETGRRCGCRSWRGRVPAGYVPPSAELRPVAVSRGDGRGGGLRGGAEDR